MIANIIIRLFLVIGLLALKGTFLYAPEFLLRSPNTIRTDTSFISPWRYNPGLCVLFQFDLSEACTKLSGCDIKNNNTF